MLRSGGRQVVGLVLAGLMLAILACGGGTAAPTAAPDTPTVIVEDTQAPPTVAPTATQSPTAAPTDTASPDPTALDVGSSQVSEVDGMTQMYRTQEPALSVVEGSMRFPKNEIIWNIN